MVTATQFGRSIKTPPYMLDHAHENPLKIREAALTGWSLPVTANPMMAVEWTSQLCEAGKDKYGSALLVALGITMLSKEQQALEEAPLIGRGYIQDRLQPMVRGTYFWSPPLCDLAYEASQSLPDYRLQLDSPPSPWGIFWFGRPRQETQGGAYAYLRGLGWCMCQGLGGNDDIGWLTTTSLQPEKGGVFYLDIFEFVAVRFAKGMNPYGLDGAVDHGVLPLALGGWGVGDSYEESGWVSKENPGSWMTSTVEARSRAKLLATCFLLLKQKVVTHERVAADRATSRRLRDKAYPEGIARVTLREAAARPAKGKRDVEWSCRWNVRTHWHNYAVGPGRMGREPRLVHSYLKGPAGKPIKFAADKLFVVSR